MESSSVRTSTSSLNILGWSTSGLIELCASKHIICSFFTDYGDILKTTSDMEVKYTFTWSSETCSQDLASVPRLFLVFLFLLF